MTLAPDSLTPAPISPDARDDTDSTAAGRLLTALLDRALASRGLDVGRTPSAVDQAVTRASRSLPKEEVDAVKGAVASRSCAELLDAAVASGDAAGRALALRAVRRFVELVGEHKLASPSALAMALDAAMWLSRASAIFARSLAAPTDDELVRLHDRASARASQSLGQALRLESEAKASKPKAPAFVWPVLVQADPFPSRPRVPIDEAEDEQDEEPEPEPEPDAPEEPVESPRPNPGLGEEHEPERDEDEAPEPLAEPDPFRSPGNPNPGLDFGGWSTTRPSGVERGGRRGAAPVFALPSIDPLTGRARPSRAPGPTAEAIAKMRADGWTWDGTRWIATTKGASDV